VGSSYINHFLQPDSLIPDPSNPQAWNRYSYVGNRPINFNDPTGHKPCDEEKGCDGTLPKLDRSGGGNRVFDEERHRGYYDRPIKERKTLDDKIHAEIDHRFDPFSGWLPLSVKYETSEYPTYDYYALNAYEQAGFDLIQIASNNQDNPMKEDDWLNSDVDIDYIYSKGVRGQPPGHKFFLNYMGRDVNNPSNYEANYLNALMTTHPQQLKDAKDAYYEQLIFVHGSSLGAWEYLQMSIGVNGPD
jgi:hypothetical protein